jgi:tRNA (cmo5U34)-methyltransferase
MRIPTNWTFESAEVARSFDRHVREQLPWYELATGAVAHIGRHFIGDGGLVYDIGASTGNIGKALAGVLEDRGALLLSIDRAPQMAEQYTGPGKLIVANACTVEYEPFDFAVLFLTLQFLTPMQRRGLVTRLNKAMKPGGAIVVVDKVETSGGYAQTVLHRMTIAGKAATGTSAQDIVAKELSIAGVQRPLGKSFVRRNFDGATEFFRYGEFVGFLIQKYE